LAQHRDAHGYVEPVQQVFSYRAQVELEIAHVVATVREEGDGLIHLQPLRLKQFGQPPLGFGVVVGHEAEALGFTIGWDTLADDQLKPAGFAIIVIPSVDVAAINANRKWPTRSR
jgi:hypothetical protein